jgi:hypothetical protein
VKSNETEIKQARYVQEGRDRERVRQRRASKEDVTTKMGAPRLGTRWRRRELRERGRGKDVQWRPPTRTGGVTNRSSRWRPPEPGAGGGTERPVGNGGRPATRRRCRDGLMAGPLVAGAVGGDWGVWFCVVKMRSASRAAGPRGVCGDNYLGTSHPSSFFVLCS